MGGGGVGLGGWVLSRHSFVSIRRYMIVHKLRNLFGATTIGVSHPLVSNHYTSFSKMNSSISCTCGSILILSFILSPSMHVSFLLLLLLYFPCLSLSSSSSFYTSLYCMSLHVSLHFSLHFDVLFSSSGWYIHQFVKLLIALNGRM